MDDTLAMGVIQSLGALEDNLDHLLHRQQAFPLAIGLEGVATFDVLHDDVTALAVDAGVVNANDIGMGQQAGGVGFVEKHLAIMGARILVLELFSMSDLDRHRSVDVGVMAEVDRAHAAAADLLQDLVLSQLVRHCCGHVATLTICYSTPHRRRQRISCRGAHLEAFRRHPFFEYTLKTVLDDSLA